ncbi:MAG TPA: hypothetical protein VGA27_11570 [Candidatus Binatia bacterium]
MEKAVSRSQGARDREAKPIPLAAILECVANQHGGYRKQTERSKAIHKVSGKILINWPVEEPTSITGSFRQFDSVVGFKTTLESNAPDKFFDANPESKNKIATEHRDCKRSDLRSD